MDFRSRLLPASRELITWDIGNHGFLMQLSGQVPARIADALATEIEADDSHLALPPHALADSRAVLRAVGNLSSATVMFVLQRMLANGEAMRGGRA